MVNVESNYKRLMKSYEVASMHYQETGETHLLSLTLNELEAFERAFIACWDIKTLVELQEKLGFEVTLFQV